MTTLKCPHCGAPIDAERTWAQTAMSTLIVAPAIPDMATQVRCANCGRVSAASDMRIEAAAVRGQLHAALWLFAAALVVWSALALLAY